MLWQLFTDHGLTAIDTGPVAALLQMEQAIRAGISQDHDQSLLDTPSRSASAQGSRRSLARGDGRGLSDRELRRGVLRSTLP